MNNKMLIAVIVIILLGGGFFLFSKNYSSTPQSNSLQNTQVSPAETNVPTTEPIKPTNSANTKIEGEVTITYTDTGFAPSEITLKNRGKITWMNKSSKEVKIAVNPHPIHTGNREVSGGEFTLDLAPGDQKTVSVSKVGTFGYHNHLDASEEGKIIVQ